MDKEPLVIIGEILQEELNLTPERIFFYNTERFSPKDEDLYIVLQVRSQPPYGVKHEYKTIDGVYSEVTSLNVKESIYVQCISKNNTARKRAYEVQMAMSSDYAIKKMESNGFHISKISNVTDVSNVEGTSRLNRFDCQIDILVAYEKIKQVDYFDKFEHTEEFEG